MNMQCEICFRSNGKAYLCPMDARNELYETRIRHAQILLENESLGNQIAALRTGSVADPGQGISNAAELAQTHDRTQEIIARADIFKANVEAAKEELLQKKAENARRRTDLNAAKLSLESRRARQLEDVDKSVKMSTFKWNKDHNTLAVSRAFLCGEAAKLSGLKRVRKNDGKEEYAIGNVSIMNLQTLNTASPASISTALSHVVHLLMLATHYLSLRLPAEITLPHRDYPLPTIFPLATSYKHADNIPFPGMTPSNSSSNSPTASRHSHVDQASQPRPRPLFIKKPLPILSSEDPVAYSFFIEAVTLLAYDVAWVCRSQGVAVAVVEDNDFGGICEIGKNMYNLLIGVRSRPPPSSRTSSTNSAPTKSSRQSDGDSTRGTTSATVAMGQWSHGSAHTSLASAAGQELIRSWKLPSPAKIADKLKSRLLSEVANAEWEVLDEDAWAEERSDGRLGEETVVIPSRRSGERSYGTSMQSFMSMRTVHDAVEALDNDERDRKPGNSGWTKLKPR